MFMHSIKKIESLLGARHILGVRDIAVNIKNANPMKIRIY